MIKNLNRGNYICTYTGKLFYPMSPSVDEVDIEDIAHALSNITRFTGHTKEFYSVAQHSVLVSLECDPQDALAGLLHDASEAYISDLASPLKHSSGMEFYKVIEDKIQSVIYTKFNLPVNIPKSVKLADTKLLVSEIRDLMNITAKENYFISDWTESTTRTIVPVSPRMAKKLFLEMFYYLTEGSGRRHRQLEFAF